MINKYMQRAIQEAKKAYKTEDVPVGAIIVKNGLIIACANNKRNKTRRVIDHAEILCILKANKINDEHRLFDCDMYVTMEPCDMCKQIISEARIKNVYYLVPNVNNKKRYSKTTYQRAVNYTQTKKYKKMLRDFFNKLR